MGAPGVLPSDPGAGRVLVVEDDMTQRVMTTRILRRAGYECAAATSTAEARTLLSSQAFGVLLTDLRMFNEDGIELVRWTKDRFADVFVLVHTGLVEPDIADKVRRAGAYDILFKPVEPADLVAVVERAFEARKEAVALNRHKSG